MKINLFSTLILISITCFTSCINSWNCIDGEGPITEKVISIDDFNKIHLKSSIDVSIKQGDEYQVTVVGNSNLIERLNKVVQDKIWEIKFDKCLDDYDAISIQIVLPDLKGIGIYGSGMVSSRDNKFIGGNLDIDIYGSGDVILNGEFDALNADIKGSGDIKLHGTANTLNINIAGSGDIDAGKLVTFDSSIDIKGSGDVIVHATESLNVDIKGSGDVTYYGNPPSISTDIKGSGNISEK